MVRVSSATIVAFAGAACAATQPFVPSPGNIPATGDDTIAGGIFSISLPSLALYLIRNGGTGSGTESPKGQSPPTTTGSGLYAAYLTTDPSLPNHTIYAPKSAPKGQKLPFVAWGNGACGMDGAGYKNLLLEIASHGYVIAADGAPSSTSTTSSSPLGLGGAGGKQSTWSDMHNSIEWALKGGASGKFGAIDTDKIATAGHSCGGLSAMSNAYHNPAVKLAMLFNIAIFQDEKRYLLKEIKVPVAYLIGGPKDMGYPNANKDYELLPEGLPALKANLDTGHMATYNAQNGGKFGKAAVAYLEWQFRGDAKSKAIITQPKSAGSLVSDNWQVVYKNYKN